MRHQIGERCPCGTHLTLSDELPAAALPYRYSVHCKNCYGGERHCDGHGATREGAFADWWEQAGELWHIDDMGWPLSELALDLVDQAETERGRQSGWEFSYTVGGKHWAPPLVEVSP